jgi:uncharacterized protein (DUF849 family)
VPERQPFALFVLGRFAPPPAAQPKDLLAFMDAGGETGNPWAVCAFGRNEAACAIVATALGAHVRVGFENNVQLPDGTVAENNAALVAVAADAARLLNRPLADADALRQAFAGWR